MLYVNTMLQLILHLIGDYLLQSDWMALNKTRCSKAAAMHALTYSLPFLILEPSLLAFSIILGTHFLIDRYALAKKVAVFKNYIAPRRYWLKKEDMSHFGYGKNTPEFLATWLLIITDNTMHLAINYFALTYL